MDFLGLPTELISVVASGYLGFKVSQLGDQKNSRPEDVLIQSFIFGVLATAGTRAVLQGHPDLIRISGIDIGSRPTTILVMAIMVAALSGAVWRRLLKPLAVIVLSFTGVYRGDHHSTVLRSISNTNAEWYFINVHRKDGTVLTSDVSQTSKYVPLRGITLNDDGLCFYVTSVVRSGGETEEFRPTDEGLSTLTYIPLSEITQIDVTWR